MRRKIFLVLISLVVFMLQGCKETECKDNAPTDLCVDDRSYTEIEDRGTFKVYKAKSINSTISKGYVFHVRDEGYYYLNEDLEKEVFAFLNGELVSLKDVHFDILRQLNAIDIEFSKTILCNFYNIELDCYKGYIFREEYGEFKLYMEPSEIYSFGSGHKISENDEYIVYMDSAVYYNSIVLYKNEEISYTELYISFGYEVFYNLGIGAIWTEIK